MSILRSFKPSFTLPSLSDTGIRVGVVTTEEANEAISEFEGARLSEKHEYHFEEVELRPTQHSLTKPVRALGGMGLRM